MNAALRTANELIAFAITSPDPEKRKFWGEQLSLHYGYSQSSALDIIAQHEVAERKLSETHQNCLTLDRLVALDRTMSSDSSLDAWVTRASHYLSDRPIS